MKTLDRSKEIIDLVNVIEERYKHIFEQYTEEVFSSFEKWCEKNHIPIDMQHALGIALCHHTMRSLEIEVTVRALQLDAKNHRELNKSEG